MRVGPQRGASRRAPARHPHARGAGGRSELQVRSRTLPRWSALRGPALFQLYVCTSTVVSHYSTEEIVARASIISTLLVIR